VLNREPASWGDFKSRSLWICLTKYGIASNVGTKEKSVDHSAGFEVVIDNVLKSGIVLLK